MKSDKDMLGLALDTLKGLSRPNKKTKAVIESLEAYLNDYINNARRDLEETAFEAVRDYAKVCISLDDPNNEPFELCDGPTWRDHEAYIYLLGKHIDKHFYKNLD